MRKLKLSNKGFALVDDSDYDELCRYKWYLKADGYVGRSINLGKIGGKTKYQGLLMHREIVKTPKGVKLDHKDGNRSNNQRSNLRIATSSQNSMNQKKAENKVSKYKGVTFRKDRNKWFARIIKEGKRYGLGHYASEIEAARAYNKAAIGYFGEFAKLNEV